VKCILSMLVLFGGVLPTTTDPAFAQDAGFSLEELKARVERVPADVLALRALARLHLQRGESESALALATRLLDLADDDPADRLLLARASLAESDRLAEQAADRGYRRALFMDAERSARLAARDESQRDEAELFLAEVLIRQNEERQALELLDRYLERTPDRVEALALRGALILAGATPELAVADLRRAAELAPDRIDLAHQLVRALAHRSLAEAEQALLDLIGRGAAGVGALSCEVLGTVPERAVRVLEPLTEQYPKDAAAWYFRGRALALAGRHEQAVQAYDRTLLLAPGDSSTLAFRADARGRAGDVDGLFDDLILVLQTDGDDARWAEWRLLSSTTWLAEQGDWEQIVRISSELVELSPSEMAYANLALALRWLDRVEESEQVYRDALELFPDDPRLINDHGLMLEGVGRVEEAAERFQRAAELGSVDGLENLAILLRNQRDRSGARRLFLRVLEQEPGRLRSVAGYADVIVGGRPSSR